MLDRAIDAPQVATALRTLDQAAFAEGIDAKVATSNRLGGTVFTLQGDFALPWTGERSRVVTRLGHDSIVLVFVGFVNPLAISCHLC